MIEDIKITKALSHLNKLTKEGSLRWQSRNISTDWYINNASEKIINPVYDTRHDGKNVRLFKYAYKHYTDEEVYYVTTDVKICILDYQGNLMWEFPPNRLVFDLFETVQYKLSDADSFINRLAAEASSDNESDPTSPRGS